MLTFVNDVCLRLEQLLLKASAIVDGQPLILASFAILLQVYLHHCCCHPFCVEDKKYIVIYDIHTISCEPQNINKLTCSLECELIGAFLSASTVILACSSPKCT